MVFPKIDQYLFNQKLISIFSWRNSPLKYNNNFEREQKRLVVHCRVALWSTAFLQIEILQFTQVYHIQTSRCIEASNSIRKKEAPNNSKYKLPLAVRTLVIYFCWGGILIVKWKGLCDFFSQNYLLIFSVLFPVVPADVQSRDWERNFKIFLDVNSCRAYLDTVA